jgi:hypothetical protein
MRIVCPQSCFPLVALALWVSMAPVTRAEPQNGAAAPAPSPSPAAPERAAAPNDAAAPANQPLKEAVKETIKSVLDGEAAGAVGQKVQEAVVDTLQKTSTEAMKDVTLVLRISKEFIRQHEPPPVEQVAAVDRCLFGAHVTGTATTTGKPAVSMDGDHTKPVFTLHFAGTTVTRTVATKRPVKAMTTGRAVFDVHREIRFDGTEFSDGPETIECSYDSTLDGVSVPPGLRGRIVRKFAVPQIQANRPKADAIALAETKETILESFGERTDKLVNDLNTNVPWKKTLALLAPQESDWVASFSSTKDWVEARSSHLDGPFPDLPDEADELKAPIELWVLGKPDAVMSGKLLALWGVSNVAMDRFRDVTPTPAAAVAAGIDPAIVGDWWVLRVGTDLAERFLEGLAK